MTDHLFDAYGRRWGLYCVSAGRPANVIPTKFLWEGIPITWVVPAEEAREYKAAGAKRVIPITRTPGVMPLGEQRNAALEDAFTHGATCIQTDDDGKRLLKWEEGKAVKATANDYLRSWHAALTETQGARLTGCAPLANAFYSTGKVRTQHWIMAQVFAVEPSTPRFDGDTCPREDYDFTAQHLSTYGAVARHDGLLPDFRHWGNRGGCQDWRTDERSMRVNALLLDRWPQYLRPNAKRPGELLFKAQTKHQSGRPE